MKLYLLKNFLKSKKKCKKYKDAILNYNGKGKKFVLDFPGGPVVKNLCSQSRGAGSVPG